MLLFVNLNYLIHHFIVSTTVISHFSSLHVINQAYAVCKSESVNEQTTKRINYFWYVVIRMKGICSSYFSLSQKI
jgi:hypothetical protein